LEMQGHTTEFVMAMENLGCECAPGALNRLKVVLAENVEIPDIYRIASEQNVQLRRLNFRRDTLEDIFLKAMEPSHGGL
jgi:ABC-2 type transport system ATP-binding protein